MFAIEKGVPFPESPTAISGPVISAMRAMEPGDSFALPLAGKNEDGLRSNIYTRAKSIGIKVTIRKMDGSLRVWRVPA